MNDKQIDELLNEIASAIFELKKEPIIEKEIQEKPKAILNKDYLVFNKIDLLKVIKIGATLFNLKSDKTVPKSVVITYRNDNHYLIVTNDIEYIEYKLDILNEDNKLYEDICLPISMIKSIINLLEDQITIYKLGDVNYIKLQLGDLAIESPQPEAQLIRRPGTELVSVQVPNSVDNKMSIKFAGEAFKSIIPLLYEEIKLDNRRITLASDRIFFVSTKLMLQFRQAVPKVRINSRVADIIKNLSQFYEGEPLCVYSDKENPTRFYFTCRNVFITSPCSTSFDETEIVKDLEKAEDAKHFNIKVDELRKITYAANNLPYNDGKIGFKYDKNELVIYIRTLKNSNNEFRIPMTSLGIVDEKILNSLKTPIFVSSKLVSKILEAVNKEEEITIALTKDSIIFNKGRILGVVKV